MRHKLSLMMICLALVASIFNLSANQVAASELQPFEVYVQQGESGTPTLVYTYTQAEMEALPNTTQYYTGVDNLPAVVQGKGAGVLLSTLIDDLQQYNEGVTFGPGGILKLHCTDDYIISLTYEYLLGAARYYYPGLYTFSEDNSVAGPSDDAIAIEPMFAITAYQSRSFDYAMITSQVLDEMTLDTSNSYRFCFGLLSPDDYSTVNKFAKWIDQVYFILPDNSSSTAAINQPGETTKETTTTILAPSTSVVPQEKTPDLNWRLIAGIAAVCLIVILIIWRIRK
jgi:hypothetical protein